MKGKSDVLQYYKPDGSPHMVYERKFVLNGLLGEKNQPHYMTISGLH